LSNTRRYACGSVLVAPSRSRASIEAERSKTTLPTNSGAREAQHASRRSAREAVQPHARNQNDLEVLEDQITICQ